MDTANEIAGSVGARSATLTALVCAVALTCWPGGAQAAFPGAFATGARAPASMKLRPRTASGVEVAALSEENLPAMSMPTPTPTGTPGAAGATGPSGAVATPGAATPSATPTPESNGSEDWTRLPSAASAASPAPGAPAASATSAINGRLGAAASPEASPSEVPPPYYAGSMQPAAPVSDQPLTPLINATAKDQPALSASLHFVEQARKKLEASRADEAIRLLGKAISIDSGDPYAYFYLGRAYMMKNDYAQALAFFGRSEVGLRADPQWLGAAKSFEGACLEQQGKFPQALQAYEDALQAAPNNLMARVGYGRLSSAAADANAGNQPPPLAPPGGAALSPPMPAALAPPPEDSTAVAGPPKEAPPAPAQSDPGLWKRAPSNNGAN